MTTFCVGKLNRWSEFTPSHAQTMNSHNARLKKDIKMKVAHFIETDVPGGAEKVLTDLCSSSLDYDIEPVIIHFNHPYFSNFCTENDIQQITIGDNRLFKRTSMLPLFGIQLAAILRRNNISILHSHLFGPIVGGSFGAFIARVDHVGTLHDTYVVEEKKSRALLLRISSLLRTNFVYISRSMENFYKKECQLSTNRSRVIYNSVSGAADFRKKTRHSATPPESKSLKIVTTGRLVALKNIPDLIKAMDLLSKEKVPVELSIVGDGPEKEGLEILTRDLKLQDSVKFLGYRTDVRSLLLDSDVYVQCSSTEGLSMSILEAIECGLACVASNVGANHELVLNDYNGKLFNTGDINALSSMLASYAKNRTTLAEHSANSKRHYDNSFSHKNFIESYVDLYRTLGNP